MGSRDRSNLILKSCLLIGRTLLYGIREKPTHTTHNTTHVHSHTLAHIYTASVFVRKYTASVFVDKYTDIFTGEARKYVFLFATNMLAVYLGIITLVVYLCASCVCIAHIYAKIWRGHVGCVSV